MSTDWLTENIRGIPCVYCVRGTERNTGCLCFVTYLFTCMGCVLMPVCVFICVCTCIHMDKHHQRPEKDTGYSATKDTSGCKPPNMNELREPNSGHLEEHWVLHH